MHDKLNIIFPVEIINRELDYRLFLACLCAGERTRVFVGHSTAIRELVQRTRGGLLVGKHIFRPTFPFAELDRDYYRALKGNGFAIIHTDEEGAVYFGDEARWQRILHSRLDPRVLDDDEHICTWGDFQRDFYRSLYADADRVVATGHPRFDLYKPSYRGYYESDANRLRERYGDFVLVNTNLHRVNHCDGLQETFARRFGYDPADPKTRRDFVERWVFMNHVLTNFVRLINRISLEFPALNVVIRPHPAENPRYWKTIFAGIGNVHTVHEGSVGAWLFACRAMIHDGCTTGLEAHFAGVPIINYKSVPDPRFDIFLPNLFGTRCTSEEQVIDRMRAVLGGGGASPSAAGEARLDERAHGLIANFRRDAFGPLAALIDRVGSSLPASGPLPEPAAPAPPPPLGWRRRVKDHLPGPVRRVAGRALRRRSGKTASPPAPALAPAGPVVADTRFEEFYGLSNVGLDEKLRTIQQLLDKEIRYTLHDDRLLSIEC